MNLLPHSIPSFNDGSLPLDLPIYSTKSKTLLGKLLPVTIADLSDDLIIHSLTDWRNRHMDKFFTEFHATPQRTRKWLDTFLHQSHSQMLFKIYENDNFVGHLGFKDLCKTSAILDNAIKGNQTSEPRLFVYAHHVLASWLFHASNITKLYGYVFTDNIPAIMMNKEIGWRGWTRVPLIQRTSASGDISFSQQDVVGEGHSTRYCYELLLEYCDVVHSNGPDPVFPG